MDDGSESYEPLEQILRKDTVTIAKNPKQHHQLSKPGWKQLKHVASKLVNNTAGVNNTSLDTCAASHSKGPIFQFRIQVPQKAKTPMTSMLKMVIQSGKMLYKRKLSPCCV
jgi:hypothetical protein